MSEELGRLSDLPLQYVNRLEELNLTPLWPSLRNALPYGVPTRKTLTTLWKFADIRPCLLQAGGLTPIEKAERRVLVLCNPGLGLDTLRATPTIYVGLQLILPGESAPNHRHSPSAVRFVVEGQGAFTLVGGERLPMERGDLILTPPWLWHEHGHDGQGPVIWLDALDLPLVYVMEASYCENAAHQQVLDPINSSVIRYGTGGLLPYASLDRSAQPYPLMRFPWRAVKDALDRLAASNPAETPAHLAYVNPETGRECLPTLGFSALRIAAGPLVSIARRSASAVLHIVDGVVEIEVDSARHELTRADSLAVPTHATLRFRSSGKDPAYVFMVDDAPLQRKLGIFQSFEER